MLGFDSSINFVTAGRSRSAAGVAMDIFEQHQGTHILQVRIPRNLRAALFIHVFVKEYLPNGIKSQSVVGQVTYSCHVLTVILYTPKGSDFSRGKLGGRK